MNYINKLESINYFLILLIYPKYFYLVWKIPSIDCYSFFYYFLPNPLPHENHISHHSTPYDENARLIRRVTQHSQHNPHLITPLLIRSFSMMKIGRVQYRTLLLSQWRWHPGLNGGSKVLQVWSRLMTCWTLQGFFIRNEEWYQDEQYMGGKRKDGFGLE